MSGEVDEMFAAGSEGDRPKWEPWDPDAEAGGSDPVEDLEAMRDRIDELMENVGPREPHGIYLGHTCGHLCKYHVTGCSAETFRRWFEEARNSPCPVCREEPLRLYPEDEDVKIEVYREE